MAKKTVKLTPVIATVNYFIFGFSRLVNGESNSSERVSIYQMTPAERSSKRINTSKYQPAASMRKIK